MSGKFKAIGLIVTSILVIGAIVASTAQAVEGEFTASAYPAEIAGEALKPYELKIAGKAVICKSANSTSLELGNSKIYTDKFTYFECSVGGLPATVTMNGCDYERKSNPKKVKVVCPPLKNIELHVYANAAKHAGKEDLCKYSIGEQELEGVEYQNESGLVEDLRIEDNLKSIKYTVVEGSKLLCGSSAENGELLGNTTERATTEGGSPVSFMVG